MQTFVPKYINKRSDNDLILDPVNPLIEIELVGKNKNGIQEVILHIKGVTFMEGFLIDYELSEREVVNEN